MPSLEFTDELAEWAHRNQKDKNGAPYIEHPRAVALAVQPFGNAVMIVALLHDVVEDTDVTLDDLRAHGYPPKIVDAVDAITRRDGETYADFIERVKMNSIARVVKMADIMHNLEPARVSSLDPATAKRLHKRYVKALSTLLTSPPVSWLE